MSDQIPSPEQQSAAFEEAIAYLDSLPPGELERRIAEQDSAAERWPRSARRASAATTTLISTDGSSSRA